MKKISLDLSSNEKRCYIYGPFIITEEREEDTETRLPTYESGDYMIPNTIFNPPHQQKKT